MVKKLIVATTSVAILMHLVDAMLSTRSFGFSSSSRQPEKQCKLNYLLELNKCVENAL